MKKKVSFFCLAGIVVIAGGMFLFSGKKAGGGMKLETEKVSRSSISNVVTATGTVEPVTEVDVGTQVSGIVSKLYADYNDVVTAGQLIAKMDTVTLHAELQSATAQLNKSKSEYEYQQKNYARNKVLYEKNRQKLIMNRAKLQWSKCVVTLNTQRLQVLSTGSLLIVLWKRGRQWLLDLRLRHCLPSLPI